jgi:tetratricopeptide (TPR) repeat protein
MTLDNFYFQLRKRFNPTQIKVLVPAIMQEPLVWNYVSKNLSELLENPLFADVSQWTPERLGLFALGYLREDNSSLAKANQKAAQMMNMAEKPVQVVFSLAQATAIILCNIDRTSPKNVKSNVLNLDKNDFALDKNGLKAVYACIPIEKLTLENSPLEMAIHCALCQPVEEEKLALLISEFVKEADFTQKATTLQIISLSGRKSLMQQVANKMIENTKLNISIRLNEIPTLRSQAMIYQAAGKIDEANSLLNACTEELGKIQTNIGEQQKAVKNDYPAIFYDDGDDGINTDLKTLKVLQENGNIADAGNIVLGITAKLIERAASGKSVVQIPQYILDSNPTLLIDQLQELGQDQDALQVALLFLKYRPTDVKLLTAISLLLENLGDYSSAALYAEIVASLNPEEKQAQYRMADLYGAMKDWEASYQTWKHVLADMEEKEENPLLGLAQAALHTNRDVEVQAVTQQVIEKNNNCAEAYRIRGKSFFQTGQISEAIDSFNNAIMLSVDDQESWLALASAYARTGAEEASVEVLRKASMANPESVEINYAFADALLNTGEPSEAIPILKKCVHLAPKHSDTALKLGKTLGSLGNYGEAEQILKNAFQKWPTDHSIAKELAKVLINSNKKSEAVKPLEVVTNTQNASIDELMTYADCLLGSETPLYLKQSELDEEVLNRSITALKRVLACDKSNQKAIMLAGEAYLSKGEPQLAKDLYLQVIDQTQKGISSDSPRMKTGLGLACMQLGDNETAIAVFQEASSIETDNVFLQQKLAEAYEQVKLGNEAALAAECALKLDPKNIKNLNWYASLAERLGRFEESIQAHETAAELESNDPSHALEAARLLIQQGDNEHARNWLEKAIRMETLKPEDYRNAAYCFLRLQDTQLGFDCLEKAVDSSNTPSADMVLELSILTRSLYGDEKALHVLQKGMKGLPEARNLLTFQADLCHALHHDQEAFASLEKAKQIKIDDELMKKPAQIGTKGLFNSPLCDSVDSDKDIDIRMAALYIQQGNLRGGLEILEGLLKQYPDDLLLRIKAIEAAYSLLDFDRVEKFSISKMPKTSEIDNDQLPLWIEYLSLLVEIALHQNKDVEASIILNDLISIDQKSARVKALQARLLKRKGDTAIAKLAFQDADQSSKTEWKVLSKDDAWSSGLSTISCSDWLADAALELGYLSYAWNEAEKASNNQKGSLKNILQVIKIIVNAAYTDRLRNELFVITNSVNPAILEDGIGKLENAIEEAKCMGGNFEIEEWYTIGKAVLDPIPANVHAMLQYEPSPETAIFHVAVLRWINNHANALEICEKFDNDPNIFINKALCNYPINIEESDKSIAKAISLAPDQPLNYVLAAIISAEKQNINNAFTDLEAALKIWQDEPEWLFMEAKYADDLGNSELAIETYKKSALFENGSGKYALAYGNALLDAGKAAEAVEFLEPHVGHYTNDQEIRISLGTAYLKSGKLEEAATIVKKLLEENCATSDCYMLISQLAYRQCKDDEAVDAAQKAVNLNPKDKAAIYFLVQLLRSLDKPVEALSNLEQHLPEVEGEPEFDLLHAELVYEVDGAQAALPLVEEINKIKNKSLNVLKLMAKVWNECGEIEKFTQAAQEGLKIDPTDTDLNLWLAKSQSKSGQLDQAVQHYSTVVQKKPENVEAYLDLAELFQKRREEIQAVQILQKAIEAFPQDHRPYYEAGLILKEMKDFPGAEVMLRRAAELSPTDLQIRRQLGAIIALNLVHQV